MNASPTRQFCTYFDRNYLSRGLALYDSLVAYCPSFRLFVLCLDEQTHAYLVGRALPGMVAIARNELEARDPELLAARPTRTLVEYYFTSTPCWIRFLFERFPEIDLLTYVDADFWFFASPEPLFDEMGPGSIAVVEHRFPPALKHQEDRGRFNVGWLSFRRDEQGLACVAWWRERCIEWCYDRLEGDKFADQKYLDHWPRLFSGLVVLQHKGVSVAPWNLEANRLGSNDAAPTIDGQPLICFHYHGFKHIAGPLYESGLQGYPGSLNALMRRVIFEPYLKEFIRHENQIVRAGITGRHAKSPRYVAAGLRGVSQRLARVLASLVSGTYLWARRSLKSTGCRG